MVVLEAAPAGLFEIVISTALVLEELLDSICDIGLQVKVKWQWRPQLEDPDDEMVLETAINGFSNAIVTFNRTDFIRAGRRFDIAVLSPREALGRMNPK